MGRMAERRSQQPLRLGLNAIDAAIALGIGETKFRALVVSGGLPKPRLLGGQPVWDVDELYSAFKSLPHDGDTGALGNSWAHLEGALAS